MTTRCHPNIKTSSTTWVELKCRNVSLCDTPSTDHSTDTTLCWKDWPDDDVLRTQMEHWLIHGNRLVNIYIYIHAAELTKSLKSEVDFFFTIIIWLCLLPRIRTQIVQSTFLSVLAGDGVICMRSPAARLEPLEWVYHPALKVYSWQLNNDTLLCCKWGKFGGINQ